MSAPDALLLGRPADSDLINPEAHRLGPDPEPFGVRAETLHISARAARVRNFRGCPLGQAFGRRSPCTERACIYHDVPGVPGHGCAIRQWVPSVARNPELAGWFLARRREAALAADSGAPVLVPTHELPTPGPGD